MLAEFTFDETLPDKDQLERAWLCEIEKVLSSTDLGDKDMSFFISGLRLATRYKSIRKISVSAISKLSGYSRATFFRTFGNYQDFALEGYRLTCKASVLVYEDHLRGRAMSRPEFVKFTSAFFYGANICMPTDIVRELWMSRQWSQLEFHPHLPDVARVMGNYLRHNEQTRHILMSDTELLGVVQSLDLDILMARLDERITFPSMHQYRRLGHFLEGALMLGGGQAEEGDVTPLGTD